MFCLLRTSISLAAASAASVGNVAPSSKTGALRLATDTQVKSGGCPTCSAPELVGSLLPKQLEEISGLASSEIHSDIFYGVSDTPAHGPQIFVIKTNGKLVQTLTIEGVAMPESRKFGKTGDGDWEAVAVGPCALAGGSESPEVSGSCIYVGDIGHNCAREDCPYHRDIYRVIRVREPDSFVGKEVLVDGESLWFKIPQSPDAESLMLTPDGHLFTATKMNEGHTIVYRVPLESGNAPVDALEIGRVQAPDVDKGGSPLFDGASVRKKDGTAIGFSLRTRSHVIYFPLKGGESVVDGINSKEEPCLLPAPADMPQAESVTWLDPDGGSYLLSSEHSKDVYQVTCGFDSDAPKRSPHLAEKGKATQAGLAIWTCLIVAVLASA